MPEQTFRYMACGGFNTVLGLAFYFVCYKYILKEQNFDLGFYAFKPHNAALFASFILNFVVGFTLMKYVVFVESNLKGRIQLFRYFLSFVTNLILNYFLLKLFVEVWQWDAILSQCLTTCIVILISYLSQKHFTFKVKN
ncbi:MAG: GtrA family protein [Ferruginibacter sp.]|nr:GtrA family protein [Ferruginibacter sp.]